MYPNVDQSLAAIRSAEAAGEAFDRYLSAANCNALFDHVTNPQGYERITAVVRQARLSDDTAAQAVPQLVFMADPQKVHVLRDLREVGHFHWLWGVRWTAGHCDIGEAPDCVNASGYVPPVRNEVGPTTYVTVTSHPPVIVAVEICGPCLHRLKEVAEGGEILAEVDESIRAEPVHAAFVAKVRAIRAAQEAADQ